MIAQKICEFFPFFRLISQLDCKSFLEIGSLNGDTLLRIGCTMDRVVSVDMPGGNWGSGDAKHLESLKSRVSTLRDRCGVDTTLILGDSSSQEIVARVSDLGPFDAIFIDADHRYEAVKRDWENYGPLATKVVGFHDIDGVNCVYKRTNAAVGVPKLWGEIKETHKTVEFIENWSDRPMGIGAVIVGGLEKGTDKKLLTCLYQRFIRTNLPAVNIVCFQIHR